MGGHVTAQQLCKIKKVFSYILFKSRHLTVHLAVTEGIPVIVISYFTDLKQMFHKCTFRFLTQ